jgi:hypothetical protein
VREIYANFQGPPYIQNTGRVEKMIYFKRPMKIAIFAMALTLLLGMFESAEGQTRQEFTLRPNQQKSLFAGKLKVKFVEVTEDSRCPTGVDCIWAGNAVVKVIITGYRAGAKTVELNTNAGVKGDQLEGYAINLEGVTPYPKAGKPIGKASYRASFSVSRLVR